MRGLQPQQLQEIISDISISDRVVHGGRLSGVQLWGKSGAGGKGTVRACVRLSERWRNQTRIYSYLLLVNLLKYERGYFHWIKNLILQNTPRPLAQENVCSSVSSKIQKGPENKEKTGV